MLKVPMQPVKKETMTEWNGVADVTVAPVIVIPVEESRKLSARVVYF